VRRVEEENALAAALTDVLVLELLSVERGVWGVSE
jgi:hypothetical protein